MSISFLEQLIQVKQGINYLVPAHWLMQFKSINQYAVSSESLQIPELKLIEFADTFLLDFQSHLIEELQAKCNFLKFCRVRINLQINPTFEWTPISSRIWRKIKDRQSQKHQIITILSDKQSGDIKQTKQVQIIYCSKTRSDAFVGYMPITANLVGMIRQIGFDMGFIQVDRSKIIYLSLAPEKSYTFHELEEHTLESAPDSIFMAFNLEREVEEEELPHFYVHHNQNNESNEAVVGDLNTMEDDSNTRLNEPIRNRTISTGAETPFSFALSNGFDLDRQYRVNELFGAKEPEQIQEMKQLASSKINNQSKIIQIPSSQQKTHLSQLQRLAQQMLQFLNKKRSSKQKQIDLLYE